MKLLFIFTFIFITFAVNGKLFRRKADKDIQSKVHSNDLIDKIKDVLSNKHSRPPPIIKSGQIHVKSAYVNNVAAHYNYTHHFVTKIDCSRHKLATTHRNKAVAGYYYLDFGSGAQFMHFRYATLSFANVKVYTDNPDGVLVADFDLEKSAAKCNFTRVTVPLLEVITGIHHLYFVVSSDTLIPHVSFDHFRFSNTPREDLIKYKD